MAVDRVGCADGSREAFVDAATFPTLAGCAASWSGQIDLRAARTGASCGDRAGGVAISCVAASDACSAGWHVCGDAGDPLDVNARISADQCASAGGANQGAYLIAMQHCSNPTGCLYATP